MAPFKNDTEDLIVPDTEWWDNAILTDRSYSTIGDEGAPPNLKGITHYVQHPIEMEPPAEPAAPAALPMMLTKQERKKLRTQRRKAEEREKQEKIRLGLLDAPAPKVKKANFMRVLGVEAVADPTQIENLMKKQVAIRKRDHDAANTARAKTKEQKREKSIAKLQEDTSKLVHVAVYRVNDMKSDKLQYQVDINAKQNYLTGVTVMTSDALNVVVVEGGPKGLKKYKRLMLHRIKWADDAVMDDEDDSDDEKPDNACVLVWEGTVLKRSFPEFEMKLVRSEKFARDYMDRFGVPHYWDMALTNKVNE
jgi:U4/U6 small nuclear ribonucleoprotein PRP3